MLSLYQSFPFSAIVGQENLKRALVLNAINPRIGGLLISGAKGTGKSLVIKAFAEILPETDVIEGCLFNCNPNDLVDMCTTCHSELQKGKQLSTTKRRTRVVQLPISVTEDRLLGSLDIETALTEGTKTIQLGLLAEANQNILHIDDINLLPDHLVNCFLDPIASGWNVVEREGVSITHPARFTLIASMNPEEGTLRPQILDRFALYVETASITNLQQRMLLIRRNLNYEEDPLGFCKQFEKQQKELKNRIVKARQLLSDVILPDSVFASFAQISSKLKVDGSRSDIAAIKSVKALAAFKGRTVVEQEDVLEIIELAYSHRQPSNSYNRFSNIHTLINRYKEDLSNIENLEPPKNTNQVNQRVRDVLNLTESLRADRRRRRNREMKFFNAIYPLMIFAFIFILYFATLSSISYLYHLFSGLPLEGFTERSSLSRLWPYILGMTVVTLSIPLLLSYLPFKKHRRSVPVYLYRASGGTIGRRIVQQLHPSSHSSLNRFGLVKAFPAQEEQKLHPTNILNIPLYASLNRLFKLIINKGPKVAENLKQLRAKHQKYEISLTQRIGIRKGNLIGKRVKAITSSRHGRYVCYRYPWKKPWDIALAPTIRAAAPSQSHQNNEKLRITIKPQDIRVKMREAYTPLTIVLLLDMSESMAASLENIRNAVLSMHDIASKKRDRVALVIFKGSGALVLQPPTRNLHLIEKKLLEIGTSDFTPLAAGMFQGWKVLRNEKMRNRDIIPILILISDGIVNIALDHPFTPFTRARFLNPAQADVIDIAGFLKREGIRTIVINTAHEETGKERPQYATKISAKTNKLWMDPTRLLLEIPRITGGYYYGVGEGGTIESAILIDAFTIVNRE